MVRTGRRVEAQTQARGNHPEGCLEEAALTGLQGHYFVTREPAGERVLKSPNHACATCPVLPAPVSRLQADFTLLDRGSGPRVEVSCQVSSGSPPITYSLVSRDGHVHMRQRPTYGQPANFSFPLTQKSDWFRCQAENDISVQSSPLTLVPPGERAPWFPEGTFG